MSAGFFDEKNAENITKTELKMEIKCEETIGIGLAEESR